MDPRFSISYREVIYLGNFRLGTIRRRVRVTAATRLEAVKIVKAAAPREILCVLELPEEAGDKSHLLPTVKK